MTGTTLHILSILNPLDNQGLCAHFRRSGYQAYGVESVRRAVKLVRDGLRPDIIVSEFHPLAFNDRVSALEALLAHRDRDFSESLLVVLADTSVRSRVELLGRRFRVDRVLYYPIKPGAVWMTVERMAGELAQARRRASDRDTG